LIPYTYSSSRRRRARRPFDRVTRWARRRGGPVAVCTSAFAFGLFLLVRHQSDDLRIGVAVTIAGFAGLLMTHLLDGSGEARPEVAAATEGGKAVAGSGESLDEMDRAMAALCAELAENERRLRSLVESAPIAADEAA